MIGQWWASPGGKWSLIKIPLIQSKRAPFHSNQHPFTNIVYTYKHIHTYVYTLIHVPIYAIHTYICCMYTYKYVYIYCIFIYTYLHIYIHLCYIMWLPVNINKYRNIHVIIYTLYIHAFVLCTLYKHILLTCEKITSEMRFSVGFLSPRKASCASLWKKVGCSPSSCVATWVAALTSSVEKSMTFWYLGFFFQVEKHLLPHLLWRSDFFKNSKLHTVKMLFLKHVSQTFSKKSPTLCCTSSRPPPWRRCGLVWSFFDPRPGNRKGGPWKIQFFVELFEQNSSYTNWATQKKLVLSTMLVG